MGEQTKVLTATAKIGMMGWVKVVAQRFALCEMPQLTAAIKIRRGSAVMRPQ